jgi:hypothetical protein
VLTTRNAEVIARKLGAEISPGRKHVNAVIRVDGVYIGRFGIRRGTNVSHIHIPKQIHVSLRQALELARCRLDAEDYKKILQERGTLPPDPEPQQ